MTDQSQPDERRWRAPAVVLVAVLAIVLVVTGGVALITNGPPRPSVTPSPPPTAGADGTPSPPPTAGADGFPTEVLGMPVVTVHDVLTLFESGALDGRAVAVGGWWLFSIDFPCPYVPAFVPPLLGDCHEYQGLASQAYSTYTCDDQGGPSGCGTGASPAGTSEIELRSMAETSGWDVAQMAAYTSLERRGAQAVIIGHAGDPRQLHCLADARASCARQFVVDRVAWLAGEPVELRAYNGGVPHGMVWPEAVAAARKDGEPISVSAVTMGDAPTVDPRLHGVGGSAVWVVRTVRASEALGDGDATSGVDVTLVDDATGNILASVGLELAADYQPGTIIVQATDAGASTSDQVVPYYRVETPDGAGIQEMHVGEDSWTSELPSLLRYGAGLPAVVDAGDYVIRAWRAQAGGGELVPAQDECRTQVHVDALAVARVQADFPTRGACRFVTPAFESYFDR